MARRPRVLLVIPAVALAAACGEARQLASHAAPATRCSACHGDATRAAVAGADPLIAAAPPRDVRGGTDTGQRGVGAHQRHLAGGPLGHLVACDACHRLPVGLVHAPQAQGHVTFSGFSLTSWGTVPPPAPTWDGVGCAATYCHGAFPGGNAANAPRWTVVDGSQAACGTCHGNPGAPAPALPTSGHAVLAPGASNGTCNVCHAETVDPAGLLLTAAGKHLDGTVETDAAARHPAGWAQAGSLAFHGPIARLGVATCQRCHADQLPARVTAMTCADCHGQAGVLGCNGCHGSAANAAPPVDRGGQTATTALGVGAHQAHVTAAGGQSTPFDCAFCHVKPSGLYDVGHIDGNAVVTGYTGSDPAWRAVGTSPGWNRGSATCATAYCHGTTLLGGTNTTPLWTKVDGTQAACGSCHGLPPDDGPIVTNVRAHFFHARSRFLACVTCHLGYPLAGGVNPAVHVNGKRDVVLPDGTVINGWDCTTCHAVFGI